MTFATLPSHQRDSHTLLRFFTVSLAVISFAGCAIFQPGGRPSDPLEALRYDIEEVLADSIFTPARTSIKVTSLQSHEVIFERDSKLLMRPASNMKLLTSAAGLHYLGSSHQFKTSLLADSATKNGVLEGNLYLKGFGDPDLTSADLDTLAQELRQRGLSAIQGAVLADASYFDDAYWGYGWNWDDEPYSYATFTSPLSVNDNCVQVTVTPGEASGDTVAVEMEPSTSYLSLTNKAVTVEDSARAPLVVTRPFKYGRLNTVIVEGELKKDAKPVERQLSVWKPELYAATLLDEALRRQGIALRDGPGIGSAPASAIELASISRPFDTVVTNLNKVSDNLSAEMMLKTLSVVTGNSPGSSEGGVFAVNLFLSTFGIDTTRIRIADGSGLSFYNLLTAEMIVQLLEGMSSRTEIFPVYFASLPVAGVDGTLRNRMRHTPAEGILRAKTGTISGVSSLSGYVETADRERFAFSMSMQNFIYPARLYQRAQDKIGALLAGFSRNRLSAAPKP